MNTYTVFNGEKILSLLTVSEETLLLNINEGESYVEGNFSDEFYYVKNNEIRAFPEKPDYPVTFDEVEEQWVWNEPFSWALLRHERDVILSENVDPIVSNSLRWAGLSSEKQQGYVTYRQSLLDLPANTTDPRDIAWPTKPAL